MKKFVAVTAAALALSMGGIAIAQSAATEINYPKGSLAFDSIVAGDYRKAASTLEASEKVDANDPARQINLGYAYAKLGRQTDARNMFKAAASNRRSFDLILADGTIVNSRLAAKMALGKLDSQFAAR